MNPAHGYEGELTWQAIVEASHQGGVATAVRLLAEHGEAERRALAPAVKTAAKELRGQVTAVLAMCPAEWLPEIARRLADGLGVPADDDIWQVVDTMSRSLELGPPESDRYVSGWAVATSADPRRSRTLLQNLHADPLYTGHAAAAVRRRGGRPAARQLRVSVRKRLPICHGRGASRGRGRGPA